ncbi:insulin receptor-like [Oppia nitens]|uniref:insulin receptor-like n=1 Tax=Oppia nitens TaxID=1686743 RepID=UPI0023D9E2E8|nr:insulin receptor-like [Oppia nitens]
MMIENNCSKMVVTFVGLLFLSIVCLMDPISAQEIVCGSVDIRNTAENFNKLRNCSVVEGYIQIVLIDNGTPKDYENLTFPALREITDYLLVFRAMGLPTLGKLFPNLSVIRGRNLFHDFALVIYEMLHLQQIGLRSLTHIVRGAVRIEKNPNLCFIETIDWDRIARSAKNGHYIHGNKARKECPTCSSKCLYGSTRTPDGKVIGDQSGRLCWNSQNDSCQHLSCPVECERNNQSCSRSGRCCDKNCLSGCSNSDVNQCFSCQKFFHLNKCVNKCPKDTYEYLGRRCVTKEECLNISAKYYNKDKFLKPIDGVCTTECPLGFSENSENRHKCESCDGPCPKVCSAAQVTNIASAQSLRGCTKINGSLEIYIQSGGANVIRELEDNLQHLEEITGFLKVARSFPLITLNFLKRLRLIHGNQLERNEYSFLVLDNPNLQDLWSFDDNSIKTEKSLTILRGKIFFHINPKLCYNKIVKMFDTYADIRNHSRPWDTHDVSPHSNGDKVACEVQELEVFIWGVKPEMVGIRFQNFKHRMDDQRSLLGYLIYYKEAPYKNISIYDGRDACSTNFWKVDDYEAGDNDDQYITHIIPQLKPYTQYALYIKTYTIASETKGAQSAVHYFKTEEDTPSQPRKLSARSENSLEIMIEWEEPSRPNGEVTHFLVTATQDMQEIEFSSDRNYCLEPITHDTPKKIAEEIVSENNCTQSHNPWIGPKNKSINSESEECCSCKPTIVDGMEAERRISFEDHLINTIYVKKPNIGDNSKRRRRRRRETGKSDDNLLSHLTTESIESNVTTKRPLTTSAPVFQFQERVNVKSTRITNLTHFTEYTIEVRACQDRKLNDNRSTDYCSLKAMTSVRTLPLDNADDIIESTITSITDNNTTAESQVVYIKWDEPSKPNGFIVSYHLKYKKVSIESAYTQICITQDQYRNNNGHILQDLSPGNYSFILKAHSLASLGKWTKPVYFTVKERPQTYPLLIYIVIPVAAVVSVSFVILAGVLYLKYKKNKRALDYVSVNPEYISAGIEYQADPYWEVDRDKIRVGKELGQGSFGMVYEGDYLKDKELIKCAVKTVNDAMAKNRIDFLKEADVMKSFVDCNHVVKLLGIISKGHPVYVLMEIMANGDLRTYLRSHRPDSEENPNARPPTLKQLIQMAIEIADGMAYLASKKFVHRDLAARNCMVAENMTVKIGDFGMTRDIYETDYYRKGGKGLLPVRWMAPESLKDGVFTTYSDIWSYGIVLWEMATLASQPYQGLSNEAVLKYVVDGGKMQRPEDCPQKLWDLMSWCWGPTPKRRPNFIEVIEFLLNDTNEGFLKVSYYSKYKSQLKQHKSSSQSIVDDMSMPLKQISNSFNAEENLIDTCDDPTIHFFPLSREICVTENGDNEEDDEAMTREDYDIDTIDEFSNEQLLKDVSSDQQNNMNNHNSNSKQSSDGSKGSKISSTTSNGSIANGHIVQYKTTMC